LGPFNRTIRLLAAEALVIASAACQAGVVPGNLLPTPLDPFVRHPYEGGCCGVAGTLELQGTCVGIRQASGEWDALLWPESALARLDGDPLQIQVNGTWIAVGEPTKVAGYWAANGGRSAEATWITEHGVKDRCPSPGYFIVTDTGSSSRAGERTWSLQVSPHRASW
jgi:hypothetical protein